MVLIVQPPGTLDIIPEHVADPVRRAPWRKRLLTGCGDGVLSLLLNGAVVGWLIGVGWSIRAVEAPQAVSVDLVDHMPMPDAASPAAAEARSHPKSASAAPDGATPAADAPAPPTSSDAPSSEPESQPPAHPSAASTPDPTPAPRDPSPPTGPSNAAPSDPQSAVPPPPEHPDNQAAPRLVEAPSAPPPPETAKPDPLPEPPTSPMPQPKAASTADDVVAAPQVTSSPDSSDPVPLPVPEPDTPKPLTAEQKRQAETTAKLAAMLPFGANIAADPSQMPAPSQGQEASAAYRGAVYANFNKAQDVIADARAKHLKGQAVIAFSIDDHGGIASIAVAVSSGNPAVDQAALAMIRGAAPFPPPPPGAQRAFSPAIGLGLDE